MEANAQPSFIPHDAGEPVRPRRSGGGIGDLLLMLAILAFAASAALAVGVFLYQQYLTTASNNNLAKLNEAEKSFQPALIEELQRLDRRMRSAEEILATHLAPSAFFIILNTVTAKTVSYSSLSIAVSDTIKLEMDGIARSVNSVAFQADILAKEGAYQDPIFSNLSRQQDGVHFHLSTLINPDSINFEALTDGAASALTPASMQAVVPVSAFSPTSTSTSTSTPTQ